MRTSIPSSVNATSFNWPRALIRGFRAGRRRDVFQGREHLIRWYTAHARRWLAGRVERFQSRIDVEPSGITVQDLGYRWGSCGKGDRLYFHWRSILLPPPIVEYIVAHELVHLREPHHTPAFWSRLERLVPDFAKKKQWLAENAGEVMGM